MTNTLLGYNIVDPFLGPPSEVQIVNLALKALGISEGISDLAAEESAAAAAARDAYPIARDTLLRMHPWGFALGQAVLAPDADAPLFGFSHAFSLPADCVGIHAVYDGGYSPLTGGFSQAGGQWRTVGKRIYANTTVLKLTYVRRVQNPADFDPLFTRALIYLLAMDMAQALTGSDRAAQRAAEQYKYALREAQLADAFDRGPEDVVDSDALYHVHSMGYDTWMDRVSVTG